MFRYLQQRLSKKGTIEELKTDYPSAEIVVGRGGRSQIILSSREISLEHALFKYVPGELSVSDLDSLGGVRVNGKRVKQATLRSNDRVQLGDIELLVHISGDGVSILHRIAPVAIQHANSTEDGVERLMRGLRIDSYLPSMRLLSYLALAAVCLFALGVPRLTGNQASWSSGPISSSHSLIEADCKSCHLQPFQPVRDQECLACHSMSEHAHDMQSLIAAHPERNFRCAQCHMDHNGDAGLISHDSRFCSSCHSDIKGFKSDTKVLNVFSFDSHPQFRVAVKDESGQESPVSLDDKAHLRDTTPIKLNHAVHLKEGLRGKNGPVTLQCSSCHEVADDFRSMKPIRFESHCRDCHSLGFDERLPDVEVPHGDSEAVYSALLAEYTKLFLAESGTPPRTQPKERRFPAGVAAPAQSPPLDIKLVTKSARDAETQLFTKTACALCHEVSTKDFVVPQGSSSSSEQGAHYTVAEPHIPSTWFKAAKFSHGAHEPFSCESCHEGVAKSTKTTDVLLPAIESCRECHTQHPGEGAVRADCTVCHSYHAPQGVSPDSKRDIDEYLRSLTR